MAFRFAVLILLVLLSAPVFSQDSLKTQDQIWEEQYQKRIQKEYINRVYIPKDLGDAFIQLNSLIDDSSRQKFLSVSEAEAAIKLHFSLGRWIIHNWGFYQGSRLSHYLKGLGLFYPDDMARFIIITYHRNLSKSKLEVKALIEQFVQKREAEYTDKIKQGEVLHKEVRQLPKPDSLKNE